jgi:hypothetical protein
VSENANPHRGEASFVVGDREIVLRPSFSALVAAEEELGPLFALVERAASGQLKLGELAALFWHCLEAGHGLSRDELGEAVAALGLAQAAKPLRVLLGQILQGNG